MPETKIDLKEGESLRLQGGCDHMELLESLRGPASIVIRTPEPKKRYVEVGEVLRVLSGCDPLVPGVGTRTHIDLSLCAVPSAPVFTAEEVEEIAETCVRSRSTAPHIYLSDLKRALAAKEAERG